MNQELRSQKKHKGQIVSQQKYADIRGFTYQTIKKFREEGMPHTGTGTKGDPIKIDTRAAIEWEIAKNVEKVAAQNHKNQNVEISSISIVEAQRRKHIIDGHLKQLELDRQKGSVVDLDIMVDSYAGLMQIISSGLEFLGNRMANQLAGETNPAVIREKLLNETRQIQENLHRNIQSFWDSQRENKSITSPSE